MRSIDAGVKAVAARNRDAFRTEPEVTFRTHSLRTNLADALGFLALLPFVELVETVHEAGLIGRFVLP